MQPQLLKPQMLWQYGTNIHINFQGSTVTFGVPLLILGSVHQSSGLQQQHSYLNSRLYCLELYCYLQGIHVLMIHLFPPHSKYTNELIPVILWEGLFDFLGRDYLT